MSSYYVPTYLEFGPRQADGWPAFVTEEGKAYAAEKVAELFDRYTLVDLDMCHRAVFERRKGQPECFKGVALWDAIYAVCHRAILDNQAEPVWRRTGYGNLLREENLRRKAAGEARPS
jgi:hypothetical protein